MPRPGRPGLPPSAQLWALGPHAVGAQLRAEGAAIEQLCVAGPPSGRHPSLLAAAEAAGVAVTWVSAGWLAQRCGDGHQGIAAALRPRPAPTLAALLARRPRCLVALDCVQDPHNLGAIWRSAWVMGAGGLIVPRDRACGPTAAALRAAAGAHAFVPLVQVTNLGRALDACRQPGPHPPVSVLGLSGAGSEALGAHHLQGPAVLVVGSEGGGLRPQVARNCDRLLRLPLPQGAAPLNASVAAAIALYIAYGAATAADNRQIRP